MIKLPLNPAKPLTNCPGFAVTTKDQLVERIGKHYKKQAVTEVYKLMGTADLCTINDYSCISCSRECDTDVFCFGQWATRLVWSVVWLLESPIFSTNLAAHCSATHLNLVVLLERAPWLWSEAPLEVR